jgi:PEP-CTERM motif
MKTVLFKKQFAAVVQKTADGPKEGHRILKMKRSMIAVTLTLAAAVLLLPVSVARSASMSTDFEAAPGSGYDLFFGAVQSTDFAHSPTHSIKLQLTADTDNPTVRMLPSDTLNNLNGSFWAYVPTGYTNVPYMIFGVDTDENGWGTGSDSLVIAFVNTPATHDAWFLDGLDGSTLVHVVGNRTGLTPGTYDASGTQDTLANLRNMTVSGSTTWGDLNVNRAYIEAGLWPGVTSFTGYVDDMVLTVPEPATMSLLAFALGGLVLIRKRK